jgi:hypothetical protein
LADPEQASPDNSHACGTERPKKAESVPYQWIKIGALGGGPVNASLAATTNNGGVRSCRRGTAEDLTGDDCGLRSNANLALGGSEGYHGALEARRACQG